MNVLLTGSSGLIGSALRLFLEARGHRVVPLVRRAAPAAEASASWNPDAGQIDLSRCEPLEGVVHLAGETIAQRWTPAAKVRIRQSRVEGTRLLAQALAHLAQPPQVLVTEKAYRPA